MIKIAIVGSGISGLTAAWLLAKKYDVTLYEADQRLGGHSHSVDIHIANQTAVVDTGFLVCNDRTYPNLLALFTHFKIPLVASEMSFSVQIADEGLAWAGTSIASLFGQKRNLFRPKFWLMIKDILRFNREAKRELTGLPDELSLGGYLSDRHYSEAFRNWYLLPMAAAIWSCPTEEMLTFPASSFIRFFEQHGLLNITNRPQWLTVQGGSRRYVAAMAAEIPNILFSEPVQRVTRTDAGVLLESPLGIRQFDHVVFAVHSDQVLSLLADASADELNSLSAIPYQQNCAVLHTDQRLLPPENMWSAWNFLSASATPNNSSVSVSYLINKLQPLPFQTPVLVSLNPNQMIDPKFVLAQFDYSHPVFGPQTVAAQRNLNAIQGVNHTWFCGAWTGYGFHEDGIKSGLRIAQALGVLPPWVS